MEVSIHWQAVKMKTATSLRSLRSWTRSIRFHDCQILRRLYQHQSQMQDTIQRRMHTMAGTVSILKLCKMLKAKQGKKKITFGLRKSLRLKERMKVSKITPKISIRHHCKTTRTTQSPTLLWQHQVSTQEAKFQQHFTTLAAMQTRESFSRTLV